MTIVSLCTFFIIQIPPPFPFPPMDAYDVVWNSFTSASHCLRFHLPPIPYDATSYHTVPHHVRLCLYLSFMPSLSIDSVLHAGLCRINLFTFNFSNGFDMWNGKALAFVPISSSLSPLPMFCMRCTALSFHSLRSSAHFVYLYVCFGTKCVFFPFEHFILLFLFIQCNDSIFHFSNECVRVEHEQNYIWQNKTNEKCERKRWKITPGDEKKERSLAHIGNHDDCILAVWLVGCKSQVSSKTSKVCARTAFQSIKHNLPSAITFVKYLLDESNHPGIWVLVSYWRSSTSLCDWDAHFLSTEIHVNPLTWFSFPRLVVCAMCPSYLP